MECKKENKIKMKKTKQSSRNKDRQKEEREREKAKRDRRCLGCSIFATWVFLKVSSDSAMQFWLES